MNETPPDLAPGATRTTGTFEVSILATDLGPLGVAATDDGIIGVEIRADPDTFAAAVARRTGRRPVRHDGPGGSAAHRLLDAFAAQATRFLDGDGAAFDVPVRFEGISDWDRRVLDGVRRIPAGETAGYGEIARRIGSAGAARAVGSAVGRNPIALLVPCHRVIAGDGTLGGYGGSWALDREAALDLKQELLELEGVHVPRRR